MLEHGDHRGLDVDQGPEKDCDVSPATHTRGRVGDRSALLTPARLFTQSITLSASGSRDSGCNSLPFPLRVTHLPCEFSLGPSLQHLSSECPPRMPLTGCFFESNSDLQPASLPSYKGSLLQYLWHSGSSRVKSGSSSSLPTNDIFLST